MSLSKIQSGAKSEETATCQFRICECQVNGSNLELSISASCSLEIDKRKQSTDSVSNSSSQQKNGSLGLKKLLDAHATYTLTDSQETVKSSLVSEGETCSRTTKIEVKLPPGEKLYLWQPTAHFAEWGTLVLSNIYYTKDPTPPTNEIITCTAVFREPKRIVDGSTLFRLKHHDRGQYVNAIKPYIWERATLGESRECLFKIVHHEGRYVRIEISDPMFPGFKSAFSSNNGVICFGDPKKLSKSHQWEMSIRNPVDGDVVTLRNRKWPKAGLGYHKGSDTNVYCMNSLDLDKWILEVAE